MSKNWIDDMYFNSENDEYDYHCPVCEWVGNDCINENNGDYVLCPHCGAIIYI